MVSIVKTTPVTVYLNEELFGSGELAYDDKSAPFNSFDCIPNPLRVRARTTKVIPHKGVTQVNYKVASGSSTIDIEYYN